jgi:prophage regulatory protein
MHNSQTKPAQSINRLPKVTQVTDLSRSTIYNKINPKSAHYDPTFPKPIKLGSRSIGWIEAEVQAWINSRREAGA